MRYIDELRGLPQKLMQRGSRSAHLQQRAHQKIDEGHHHHIHAGQIMHVAAEPGDALFPKQEQIRDAHAQRMLTFAAHWRTLQQRPQQDEDRAEEDAVARRGEHAEVCRNGIAQYRDLAKDIAVHIDSGSGEIQQPAHDEALLHPAVQIEQVDDERRKHQRRQEPQMIIAAVEDAVKQPAQDRCAIVQLDGGIRQIDDRPDQIQRADAPKKMLQLRKVDLIAPAGLHIDAPEEQKGADGEEKRHGDAADGLQDDHVEIGRDVRQRKCMNVNHQQGADVFGDVNGGIALAFHCHPFLI